MNAEFQQYRFARIEAHNFTRARLETQFRDGITDLDELEWAIAQQLTAGPTNCAALRKPEIEQTGCREGSRMAALEFYCSHTANNCGVQVGKVPPMEKPKKDDVDEQ